MTDEQRKRIFHALLGDGATLPIGDVARVQLEGFVVAEVNVLEPILDEFIRAARQGHRRAPTRAERVHPARVLRAGEGASKKSCSKS